jgi:hypothetical protein
MKKISIIGVVTIVLATPVISYLLALNSEPYELTKRAVVADKEIRETLGEIRNVRLAPFGYSVKYTGPDGRASFETTIHGSKADGKVFVSLERRVGAWQFTEATLNGKRIEMKQ